MARPSLTSHQREVLRRLRVVHARCKRPVPFKYIGSVGALRRLADKGYATITEKSGPRGGVHYFAEPAGE